MVDQTMKKKVKGMLHYGGEREETNMPRAKRGFKARRRRNRILKVAQGFHSARSRLFAYAKEVVMKSWVYAYAHRKRKKRDFRRLWIARINAAARTNGKIGRASCRERV